MVDDWHAGVVEDLEGTFEEFLRIPASTVVVKEPQLEKRGQHARAQLRSVPFFQLYGFDTVIHTDVMDNEFNLVEYDHVSSDDALERVSDISFPLVHVVTQDGITEYGEEVLVRRLVERSIDEDGQYILVTDTAAPKTPTFTKKPGKAIVDEFPSIIPEDYTHLSSVFLEQYLESRIPVVDTRNLFFHAASTVHQREGAPASSINEVFDYTSAPANSPIWESARYFLKHDLENVLDDYSERIREALRSWTEKGDTQRVANHILEVLQVCDYEEERLDEYRRRPPELR